MENLFEDSRIIGENSPKRSAFMGNAIGSCFGKAAVGRDGRGISASMGLISGILSAGADVYDAGECTAPEVYMASKVCGCDVCVYIREDPLIKADIRSVGGLPLLEDENKRLDSTLKTEEMFISQYEGRLSDISGIKQVYTSEIEEKLKGSSRYCVTLCHSGQGGGKTFSYSSNKEEVTVSLSSDGTKASLFTSSCGFISMDELVLMKCLELFENSENAALPFRFPCIADSFAAEHGCRILRYYTAHSNGNDSKARKLASRQRFTLDGAFLASEVIAYSHRKGIGLDKLKSQLPDFYTSKRFVELKEEKTKNIMGRFKGRFTPDGAVFERNNSRVVMQPSASGKGIWLRAESLSMEAATELCAGVEEKLKAFSSSSCLKLPDA